MLTSPLLLCARDLVLDAETDRLSVVDLVEEMVGREVPFAIGDLCILGLFQRADGDPDTSACRLVVRIGEQVLVENDLSIEFHGRRRNRTIVRLQGLVIPVEGAVEIAFSFLGHSLARLEIPVRVDGPAR